MRSNNLLIHLYKHRDLILQFTKREIEVRHKASRLGHLWALLTPLLMLGLYLFVFGVIFGGSFGALPSENFFDFALALFLGISLFQVIADTISSSPNLIANQPNFVKKVVFPLEIISIAQVLSSLYFSSLSIGICIILSPFSHGGLSWLALTLPVIVLPLAILSLGISWGLSALGVYLRDLNHITAFASTAIMYASAVVYSLSKISPTLANILRYNPLVIIIDDARCMLLWKKTFHINDIIYIYLVSIGVLILGRLLFKRLRPYFAEVL